MLSKATNTSHKAPSCVFARIFQHHWGGGGGGGGSDPVERAQDAKEWSPGRKEFRV